jgi:Fic family protein
MRQLFDWARNSNVNAILKSCILHFAIEYIHPFEDGNGRMGRLWQTVVLHSWNKNFQWIPVETMVYQNQQGYYNALHLAEKQNNTNIFIEFMLGVLKFTLGNIIESRKVKTAQGQRARAAAEFTEKFPVKFTVNQEEILQNMRGNPHITASELAEILHITDRAVKKNIAKLKSAGQLRRVGPDKGGHWEVIQ